MKKYTLLLCLIFCTLLNGFGLFAQSEPNDVYIILDISGSMNADNKFSNVKEYLKRDVFDSYLHTGDSVTLIEFGNTAKESFSVQILSQADVQSAFSRINALQADNDYTDIGLAMEKLYEVMSARDQVHRRQTILFITDGKHAPPKGSPYFGKDLGIDERFKEIGRKISQEGWFLYVVGIGADTDAQKIADAVDNSVFQTTDEKLSNVDLQDYSNRVAEMEKARGNGNNGADGNQSSRKGLAGFIQRISISLGIPAAAAGIIIYVLLGLIIIAVIILLIFIFRPITVQVNYTFKDKTESTEAKLGPGGTLAINSGDHHLPGFGAQDKKVFEIHRGLFSRTITITDDTPFGDSPPYKKDTSSKITRTMFKLATGATVQIRFK